jgi:hypothetical protein
MGENTGQQGDDEKERTELGHLRVFEGAEI